MNQQLLLLEKQCAALLDSIKQLSEEETLAVIERDLLKQQCLRIYEQILALSLNEGPLSNHTALNPEEEKSIQIENIVPPSISFVQPPLFGDAILGNEISEINEQPKEKQPQTETEIQNNQIDSILEEKQKLVEQQHQEPDAEVSLHEKIAHTIESKADLIEKLSASIPSLKNAINVNLKIALVNTLFNENTVEYVKAIDKLNTCENIHEAMRYFNELKHQYTWDSEDPNVKELEQLLSKRYH
jgi:hypothetical protein